MLLDDFYKVAGLRTIDENSIEFTVELQKNHTIFKGHFPTYPVAPGVAMLQIIKNGLESHLQYSLQLQNASSVKFLNLVNPNENALLIFHIQFTIEKELLRVKNTTTFKDGCSVLKCNVTFVKK